ncbi:hypothetical protein AZ78_4364 [Lysobacter capsici AZ78]|uniref:Uncharacterized protein n=1 Tax=Lysobacter capsici AZ78 TaxID=1444315 RepID=A0A108UCM6_9GAMM|nr:hypothetical protein AZ78_4364 [Lysobacter capsici AZ78]
MRRGRREHRGDRQRQWIALPPKPCIHAEPLVPRRWLSPLLRRAGCRCCFGLTRANGGS